MLDYDIDHARAVAAQNVARMPDWANEALVILLAAQRGERDMLEAISIAIHLLRHIASAPDSLRVEIEAAQCR